MDDTYECEGQSHKFIARNSLEAARNKAASSGPGFQKLSRYVSVKPVSHPTLSAVPPTPPPPPTKAQLKAKRQMERKLSSLMRLNAHLDDLASQGYVLVFTDGSSEHFSSIGWVGGYGIYSDVGVEVSCFVPVNTKQTTNSVDLLAAATALNLHADYDKVACVRIPHMYFWGQTGRLGDGKSTGGKGHQAQCQKYPYRGICSII